MALNLPNFFLSRGYLNSIQTYQLSETDLMVARLALKSDIDAFFLNGIVSFSSAINSLNNRNYSWCFIQSYFTLFYFARAFNGVNGYAVVYKGSKPYGIKIQPAESFRKLNGNSHDVVLNQFKDNFSNDVLLDNTIENKSPIDWFNDSRNFINYKLNPLPDPNPPINLFKSAYEIRKWILTYTTDTAHAYTFDAKHCFISYPLHVFLRVYNYYVDNSMKLDLIDNEKLDFLKKNFSDSKGPLTSITTKIEELIE